VRVEEIIKTVNAEVLQEVGNWDANIKYGFAADLLSDTLFVISREEESILLITGVTNPSVVKTAKILDIPVVLIARGKPVEKETIELARKEKIIILRTPHIVFVTCGLLYKAGLEGAPWKIQY
jgi:serine kinase of HPr protein (carbohydrate metabolism regulator)